jgi:hypothetical protein
MQVIEFWMLIVHTGREALVSVEVAESDGGRR